MRVLSEAKRQAILETACEVFLELGFERTSMDEISARVGGSKATLYRYYPSKAELFLEVAQVIGERRLKPAFLELENATDNLARALRRFGEKFLGFTIQPDAVAGLSMIIAESGHSDIGERFNALGPARDQAQVADFLAQQMKAGRLAKADPQTAALHLFALLNAEILPRLLTRPGVGEGADPARIRQLAARAIAAFMRAYGPAGASL